MSYYFWPEDIHGIEQFGLRGQMLAELQKAGFVIPNWFVLPPEAFYSSLTDDEYASYMLGTETLDLPEIKFTFQFSHDVHKDLLAGLDQLSATDETVAVRCSPMPMTEEESALPLTYEDCLYVPIEDVPRAVRSVWRSGFTEEMIEARRRSGLPPLPRAPAVIIQRMLVPDSSGVAFSADPESGKRTIGVVQSVFGLPTALNSKLVEPDVFVVERKGKLLKKKIGYKTLAHRCNPGGIDGIEQVAVEASRARQASIDDDQAIAISRLARRAATTFSRPQRIEWAIEKGRVFLLQTEEMTELQSRPDPDAETGFWEFDAVAEDYGGVTTPLSYSFAKGIRSAQQRFLWKFLHVPEPPQPSLEPWFDRMLGFIEGRICLNAFVLWKFACRLPCYAVRRDLAEALAGTGEPPPPHVLAEAEGGRRWGWLSSRYYFMRLWEAMAIGKLSINRRVAAFFKQSGRLLAQTMEDSREARAEELARNLFQIEHMMRQLANVPALNDLLLRYHSHILAQQCRGWCGDQTGELARDLETFDGPVEGEREVALVERLAAAAAALPERGKILRESDRSAIEAVALASEDFRNALDEVMEDAICSRGIQPFLFESAPLRVDPMPLYRAAGALASECLPARSGASKSQTDEGTSIRSSRLAEEKVSGLLSGNDFQRSRFQQNLKALRKRLRDRGRLRTRMAELHSRVRAIFLEFGRRLEASDMLERAEDVFLLAREEVISFVVGTSATADLKGIVNQRVREFERYRIGQAPADRFITKGLIQEGGQVPRRPAVMAGAGPLKIGGFGVSPGFVRDRVRLMESPSSPGFRRGDVLVVERPELGWAFLLPAARALVVEKGDGHCQLAVIARRMSIPAVFGAAGVTRVFKNGDQVEVNGGTGEVQRSTSRTY